MEQSSGPPTIEIPGEVPWRNTTLSAAEFVHQIRSSVLLYRPPLWKRLLAGAQTSHSQPESVTEAIALMGELETLTTSQSLSPEQRERWVWLCRRIKQVAKGRLLNDQAQTYLDLLLADGLTQLSPRSQPDGGSSEANDV